jgi:hypothetical protein
MWHALIPARCGPNSHNLDSRVPAASSFPQSHNPERGSLEPFQERDACTIGGEHVVVWRVSSDAQVCFSVYLHALPSKHVPATLPVFLVEVLHSTLTAAHAPCQVLHNQRFLVIGVDVLQQFAELLVCLITRFCGVNPRCHCVPHL